MPSQTRSQNVALVAGATGLVGQTLVKLLLKPDALGGPWKVYGISRRPRPDWVHPQAVYVQCDLENQDDVVAKLAPLTDVTHLFWVTWMPRATEAENVEVNEKVFRDVLNAVLPNATKLEHIALQTGGKHYLGSIDQMLLGKPELMHDNPYTEDLCRLPGLNFYYNLEDAMFEVAEKSKGRITWSVHRPGVIHGIAEGNPIDFLGSVAKYAAICKHENLPFQFPGTDLTWNMVTESVDADLIAEQELWAATHPRGKNQAFNVINGDMFRWRKVWKLIAEKMEVEYVPFDGSSTATSIGDFMKNKEPVWDKIVQESGLEKSSLIRGIDWRFIDSRLRAPTDILMSMTKSRECGFYGFRNTEKTILAFFDEMKERNLIP